MRGSISSSRSIALVSPSTSDVHELTIAAQVCRSLETELADEPDVIVTTVGLRVGALTGIVPAALEFAWGPTVADSPLLAGSLLEIESVEPWGYCPACDAIRTLTALPRVACPDCDSRLAELRGGDELEILRVDVRARVR